MSGMGVYVLMIVAMCATWREAEGAAFFEPLSSETTMYGSRPVVTQYCAWEGKKMMIGSSWKTTDCVTCACGGNGLHCTRYGPEGNVRVVTTHYCEWEGKKMMIGSSWKTTGCEQCSCSDAGLFCSASGTYMVPEHCLMVVDENCQPDMVDANDPFSPCGMPQIHGK
ncbi:PREDICTED: uncharacterized protein LOC109463830 isoform X4 [Branchiostoma belcheri]|uniref:Uncharacterized protein LOC109463830 isoform X4 n=1 Tax=Branchiostoma belcheri TaxID=7741 RepID=A0A6P4YGZ1_BRABE|nr:PREDICTED: uncharacterized protein LOC109463830 isoform X4 [Branchiostoma belcheri]